MRLSRNASGVCWKGWWAFDFNVATFVRDPVPRSLGLLVLIWVFTLVVVPVLFPSGEAERTSPKVTVGTEEGFLWSPDTSSSVGTRAAQREVLWPLLRCLSSIQGSLRSSSCCRWLTSDRDAFGFWRGESDRLLRSCRLTAAWQQSPLPCGASRPAAALDEASAATFSLFPEVYVTGS